MQHLHAASAAWLPTAEPRQEPARAHTGASRQFPAQLQPGLNREFSFKPADFVAKPPLEDVFGLGGIQSVDSPALPIERNMVARDIFVLAGLGNVLHEHAFTTGMRTRRIAEIQAGQRILEGRCGLVWRTNRATGAANLRLPV